MNCLTKFSLGLYLGMGIVATRGGATNAPLLRPDYERFDRAAVAGITEAARTNLAPVYPYLAEFIARKFQLENAPGLGLDIGSGPGSLAIELSKRTPRYYWINTDINTFHAETFLPQVLTNGCASRVGLVFADVHYLPFRDNYADLVVSRGSLQFWANPKAAFTEIVRVLRPGGRAFIGRGFTPNLPLDVARQVRANQGKGMPKYDVQETAGQLRTLMQSLKITDFEIILPKAEQTEVNYGVWLHFTKPAP